MRGSLAIMCGDNFYQKWLGLLPVGGYLLADNRKSVKKWAAAAGHFRIIRQNGSEHAMRASPAIMCGDNFYQKWVCSLPAGSYLLSYVNASHLLTKSFCLAKRLGRSLRLSAPLWVTCTALLRVSLKMFQISLTKKYVKIKKPAATYFPAKVQYHRRKRAWLPCSVWERVLPLHYGHRHLLTRLF